MHWYVEENSSLLQLGLTFIVFSSHDDIVLTYVFAKRIAKFVARRVRLYEPFKVKFVFAQKNYG